MIVWHKGKDKDKVARKQTFRCSWDTRQAGATWSRRGGWSETQSGGVFRQVLPADLVVVGRLLYGFMDAQDFFIQAEVVIGQCGCNETMVEQVTNLPHPHQSSPM